MNEWARLCNGWRQKREQLLTGGGWIREGAKRGLEVQKGGVIGRNHSFRVAAEGGMPPGLSLVTFATET